MAPVKTEKVVLTFLGTSHHRNLNPTLMTEFATLVRNNNLSESSNIAERLFDGVGCNVDDGDQDPPPGTYKYDFYNNTKTRTKLFGIEKCNFNFRTWRPLDNEDAEHIDSYWINFIDFFTRLQAFVYYMFVYVWYSVTDSFDNYLLQQKIFGYSVDANMEEAIAYIRYIQQQNHGHLPKEVILQGFSRGADTCVRIANILNVLHPEIKVKLFLVDHCGGPYRYDDLHAYTIPKNVVSCDFTLMLNEHNSFFKAHDADSYVFEDNPERLVRYHYLPGNHGAGISRRPGLPEGSDAGYKLLQDTWLGFAIEEGIIVKDTDITHEYSFNRYSHRVKDISDHPLIKVARFRKINPSYSTLSRYPELHDQESIILVEDSSDLYYFSSAYRTCEKIKVHELDAEAKQIYEKLQSCEPPSPTAAEIQKLVVATSYTKLSAEGRFKLFCQALFDLKTNINRPETKRYPKRNILLNRERFVQHSEFFLDDEHRNLFEQLYPNLYRFFEHKVEEDNNEVKKEIEKLQLLDFKYYQFLWNKYLDLKRKQESCLLTAKPSPEYLRIRQALQSALNHCRHLHNGGSPVDGLYAKIMRKLHSDIDKKTFDESDLKAFMSQLQEDLSLYSPGYLRDFVESFAFDRDALLQEILNQADLEDNIAFPLLSEYKMSIIQKPTTIKQLRYEALKFINYLYTQPAERFVNTKQALHKFLKSMPFNCLAMEIIQNVLVAEYNDDSEMLLSAENNHKFFNSPKPKSLHAVLKDLDRLVRQGYGDNVREIKKTLAKYHRKEDLITDIKKVLVVPGELADLVSTGPSPYEVEAICYSS